MIRPRHIPADSYCDDPASRLDPPTHDEILSIALASEALHRIFDWIMQGDAQQRSLRFHLVVLCLFPQFLPCKHPSAAWCADLHGVSGEWARRLRRDFIAQFNGNLRLRAYHTSAKQFRG